MQTNLFTHIQHISHAHVELPFTVLKRPEKFVPVWDNVGRLERPVLSSTSIYHLPLGLERDELPRCGTAGFPRETLSVILFF
jgi:hypothetical protein